MSSSDVPFADDPLFRESQAYPELFPIAFTHNEFPTSARVMAQTGTPFGCLVTPFMPMSDRAHIASKLRKNADNASKIARCDICTGYLNPYCDISPQRWFCSLCGARNNVSRGMTRYRAVDPRLLPEVQHMVVDYKTAEISPPSKPFVHVLLVQESMPLDSLNAVVDGLSSAISSVHPDIYLVLVTFSNRIGVYRLSGGSASAPEARAPDLEESCPDEQPVDHLFTPTPPPVQHIHFTYPKSQDAVDSLFDLAGVRQSAAEKGSVVRPVSCVSDGRFETRLLDEALGLGPTPSVVASLGYREYGDIGERVTVDRTIIEGRDPAVDFAAPDCGARVEPLMRIGEAINFWDACSRVGSCRSAFKNAVSSLFDACPSVPSQTLFPGAAEEDEPSAEHADMGALNMFGPAMDAVLDWLSTDPASRGGDHAVDSYDDGTGVGTAIPPEKSVMESLIGALSSFGLGGATRSPVVGADGPSGDLAEEPRAPCNLACGMMIHVLLASSPDLPQGLHESVSTGSSSRKGNNFEIFNPEWVERVSERASKNSICINVWGVAPFASQVLGLSELSPLARKTGGKTFRFLLGTTPVAEKYRLALQLSRVLSAQYASKCVMKMRASQLVDLADNGVMGHLQADPLLPGVYRMPCCSHDSTVAAFLDYRGGAEGTDLAELEHLVVQVAFSYETLVESESDTPPFEVTDLSRCIFEPDIGHSEGDSIEKASNGGSGYASTPSNLLHPENGEVVRVSSEDCSASADKQNDAPVNTRLGVPTGSYGQVEDTPLIGADCMTADEVYRRFSERICRVESDGAFAVHHIREMQELKEKNRSKQSNVRSKAMSIDFVSGSSVANLSFSHDKRLVSVRRLRVITIAVDCVNKIPRLLSTIQPEVVAVMVAREVLYNVHIDRTHVGSGSIVKIIGGLYEWSKRLTRCAAKGYLNSKLARKFGRSAKGDNGPSVEELNTLVTESVDSAARDPVTLASLFVIFGTMSRIIGRHSENKKTLTIGECIARYLGDDKPTAVKQDSRTESVIPARQKAHGSFSAPEAPSTCPPSINFPDSFAEVVSVVLTQEAFSTQRYLHPQLLPVRDDGAVRRVGKDGKKLSMSSLVVEPRQIPPNRSGLAWSMMNDGSPMFLLDAGDEIVVYSNSPMSGKKPFVGTGGKDTPLPEHLASNPKWLVNDINRRISVSSYVPRFHFSKSGTFSSGYLSNHLVDLSGDENSITFMLEDIKKKLCTELMEEDD